MTSRSLDLAEDVALVTFALHQALESYSEDSLPGGYKYHLFNGYSGFCDFAAAAALALHSALEAFDVDSLLDIVDTFAAHVIAASVELAAPAPRITLAGLAEETRRRAVKVGLATLPAASDTENLICDEAQRHMRPSTFRAWSIAFHLGQVYETTVYAATEDEAMALGHYLYRCNHVHHFERGQHEATDWQAQPYDPL